MDHSHLLPGKVWRVEKNLMGSELGVWWEIRLNINRFKLAINLGCCLWILVAKYPQALSKTNDAGERQSQTFWPQSKHTEAGMLENWQQWCLIQYLPLHCVECFRIYQSLAHIFCYPIL